MSQIAGQTCAKLPGVRFVHQRKGAQNCRKFESQFRAIYANAPWAPKQTGPYQNARCFPTNFRKRSISKPMRSDIILGFAVKEIPKRVPKLMGTGMPKCKKSKNKNLAILKTIRNDALWVFADVLPCFHVALRKYR